ncbi:MAG: rhomboid family intramembrane serine protease [Bacteroidales bacterium]
MDEEYEDIVEDYEEEEIDELHEEREKFLRAIYFPLFFLLLMWLVKLLEIATEQSFSQWGLLPRTLKGLIGIFTSPFLHSDFKHLFNNSVPIMVLGTAIFYFYRVVAYRVFLLSYLLTGICVWIGARDAYHIGASGLVYAFASFVFFSGIIRGYINLIAISLLVVFLYGSMIWGIFPIKPDMSWESHLFGGLTGLMLAIYYRTYGPRRIVYDWEEEEEEENEDEDGYWRERR